MSWWKKRRASVVGALAALAVVLVAPSSAAGRRTVVERIRYVGTVSYSRVVIDLSATARYVVQKVPGNGVTTPVSRLVIDIDGARIGPEAREPLTIGDALLQRIRTGQYKLDTARVVLDFRAAVEHRIVALPNPYRLVIDMRGPGAPAGDVAVLRLDSARNSKRILSPPAAVPPRAASASRPAEPPLATASRTLPREVARPFKVMIDPGHGGKDPGARGLGGVVEKDVVLSVARDLAERLRREPGIEVLLTRNDDRFLSLEERTAIANAAEADLFVSVHANASPRRAARGIEVYYLNNTNNRGTLRLAAMENDVRWSANDSSLQEDIPNLSYILSDLRQTYKVEESRVLADHLGNAMVGRLQQSWDGIGSHAVKEGPFYVLVGAYMPCVLVELSYLTNPVEGRRLGSRSYRQALAGGIYEGIRSYLRETRMAKNL
jgi:N-acetylmuramoyl-L-alanine amidase